MSVLVFISLGLTRKYSQGFGGASVRKFFGGMYTIQIYFISLIAPLSWILLPSFLDYIICYLCGLYAQEQNEARFCALRWATSLYNSQHCPSLYICMLSAADRKMQFLWFT